MTSTEISKSERRVVHVERWKRQLQKKIRPGDEKLIAEITKKSQSFISRVLSGERNGDGVWNIAREIVQNRTELLKRLIEKRKGKGEE
jgi:hypothetical protein